MLNQLVDALVQSKNEAADDLLLDAVRLGAEQERTVAINALLRRKTNRGLSGLIAAYNGLGENLQLLILQNIKLFHSALRESRSSDSIELRIAAMKLIALGRQGKLTYLLSDALHSGDDSLAKAAVEALVALARWVATETRRLQRGPAALQPGASSSQAAGDLIAALDGQSTAEEKARSELYHQLMQERPDIEQAVARAMDVQRGSHGADLLRAALLLADWPGSKTLTILHTTKHGGQSLLVRRLQQPPESEHVDAFLLGASHGGLRSHFGIAFSHIDEAPVLGALLRHTHWLKDHQLQLCMHQVSRGPWWGEVELMRDMVRREAQDAAMIAEWLAVSGIHDVVQDDRMERIRQHAAGSFEARLRLMRIAIRRPRGQSINLLKNFLSDSDERLVRMAAREIVRRRPPDLENVLLQMMTNAPPSVRRIISRSVGQVGFEQFWHRFDRLDKITRKAAGKAMLKILPDGIARLGRRMSGGPPAQQIKAIQIAQELGVVDSLGQILHQLCDDRNPKVRSKAVSAMGELSAVPSQVLLDRVLNDADARVRANAIEVLEQKRSVEYVPLLTQRARSAQNRERANAIKALHRMKVSTASTQLLSMLQDQRSEHRISALWTLRHIGWWRLLNEVGKVAKGDPNLRVRRYALAVLREVAETLQKEPAAKAG